jgi:LysM repeat protein
MVAAGWRETILRYATHGLLLLVIVAAIRLSHLNLPALGSASESLAVARAAPAREPTLPPVSAGDGPAAAPVFGPLVLEAGHLSRAVEPHTLIPTRGRIDVITVTVEPGDTLFGLAERFNLKPETILWGNYFTLKDDPHLLRPGQALNILPVDGVYHYVTAGNTLEQIANFYGVSAQAITQWGGNNIDPDNPQLVPGTYLVVPGGQRELLAWVLPSLPRTARASARTASNFGQCPGGYTGILGTGTFVWPTRAHTISGYDYSSIHRGIDLRAAEGDAVIAADNGVVTYAGWNEWGYGNLVVIDHGNGWESVYAHLSQWAVSCGQSVEQGEVVAQAGSSGRASGPHLHFELRYNAAWVNPLSVLP